MTFRLLSDMCIAEGFLHKVGLVGLITLPFYLLNPLIPVLVLLMFMMRVILESYFPTHGIYVIYRTYGSNLLMIFRQLDIFSITVLNIFNFIALSLLFMVKLEFSLKLIASQIVFFNGILFWSLTYAQTLAIYSFYIGNPRLLRKGWVLLLSVFVVFFGALAWVVGGGEYLPFSIIGCILGFIFWYFLPLKFEFVMKKI
jgi:hypothetical protein